MSKCWTHLLELNYGSGHIKALEGLLHSKPYVLNLGSFWVHTRKEDFLPVFWGSCAWSWDPVTTQTITLQ